MSIPICELSTVDEITARLAVLYEKADRITRYEESVAAGQPDISLLDEKQQLTLATFGHRVLCGGAFWTLRRTIDTLKEKRRLLELDPERFQGWVRDKRRAA